MEADGFEAYGVAIRADVSMRGRGCGGHAVRDRDCAVGLRQGVAVRMRRFEDDKVVLGRFRTGAKLGTTWEQLRPNTGKSGGAGPTRKQDESTR